MATQIQLRRGTAAQWTASNPTLAEGEMGIELDTSNFKIGNGVNTWSALDYGFSALPAGGATGQILAKDSNTNYDFTWIDNYTEEVGLTVRNTTGATLTKGTVVYINGSTGGKITVAKAIATSEAASAGTIGMLKADIANNANGVVITSGSVTGLNTNGYTGGAPVWLSATTAGTWSATEPSSTNHLVLIGYVENVSATVGSIFIKTATFPELNELTGIDINGVSNNQVLTYESSTGLWKNKSVPLQSISVLTDVNITGLVDNNILRYDSATSKWLAEALPTIATTLDGLTDVTVASTPANNQVLAYDTATSQWKPYTLPADVVGATTLDGLTDVTITGTPANGDVLTYDTTTSQWKQAAPAGGGSSYPTITTAVKTTASIATGANEKSTVTITQGYRLLKIETDKAARVRLYTTTTGRDADETRSFITEPDANNGVLFDYITTSGDLSNDLSPTVDGFVATGTAIPITITNLNGSTGTVTVTLTYVRTI